MPGPETEGLPGSPAAADDARAAFAEEVALPRLATLSEDGWIEAVRSFLKDRKDSLQLLDALVAGRHHAWRGFLDLRPGCRVLCIGAGYGALVESLAPHCGQLYVLDPLLPRLRFVAQRQAIFNPQADLVLLHGGAEAQLPFADNTFDAVILAEPAVVGDPAGRAGEARRLLREGGQLFLIADNRFNLALPPGWWDRLPKALGPLAPLLRGGVLAARWWRKDNGPHSLPGLTRQVTAAGFADLASYGLWPARRQFDEILPLRGGRSSAPSGEIRSWKQRLRRRSFFLPAHCLIAQAGGARRPSSCCSTTAKRRWRASTPSIRKSRSGARSRATEFPITT